MPTKKQAPGKSPRAQTPPHKAKQPFRPGRIDWEAVERDYRTGKFTQTELCNKYQTAPATLSRKIKSDKALDPTRWNRDLTEVVRQATNARLMAEAVKSAVKEGQEQVNLAVQTAAEVNKQVILRHRLDIEDTRSLAKTLLAEVAFQTASPEVFVEAVEKLNDDADDQTKQRARKALRDALAVHGRVSSVHKLADTLTKLQALERKAFNLDAGATEEPPNPAKPPLGIGDDPGDIYRWFANQRAAS